MCINWERTKATLIFVQSASGHFLFFWYYSAYILLCSKIYCFTKILGFQWFDILYRLMLSIYKHACWSKPPKFLLILKLIPKRHGQIVSELVIETCSWKKQLLNFSKIVSDNLNFSQNPWKILVKELKQLPNWIPRWSIQCFRNNLIYQKNAFWKTDESDIIPRQATGITRRTTWQTGRLEKSIKTGRL